MNVSENYNTLKKSRLSFVAEPQGNFLCGKAADSQKRGNKKTMCENIFLCFWSFLRQSRMYKTMRRVVCQREVSQNILMIFIGKLRPLESVQFSHPSNLVGNTPHSVYSWAAECFRTFPSLVRLQFGIAGLYFMFSRTEYTCRKYNVDADGEKWKLNWLSYLK